ncbi:hypothetical protein E2562_038578 [Oryza meyeriana var. granulata]|uniref:Uncharacterized protein n=1 Tax=Oryza meyeriana var. granulata TaxID=110450 RepID=A0A6G1DT80_9ORYZ|nr:hypothetical protein E2562_038578 [Oryza meyeriana var. granulata]
MAVTGADVASAPMSCTVDPCNISYKTCVGRGSLLAAAFASESMSAISEQGMLRTEMPLKWPSAFQNVARYLVSSGWRAWNNLSICPAATWDYAGAPMALAFRRAKRIASYSAMLLVVWNSSHAEKAAALPIGEVMMAAAPALAAP